MCDLDAKIDIIDTPGICGLCVVDMGATELADYFLEFFPLREGCKCHNGLHVEGPKCAIKQAVAEGQIAESRYDSYLKLLEEDTPYRK